MGKIKLKGFLSSLYFECEHFAEDYQTDEFYTSIQKGLLTIRCVEWTSNQIFGFAENLIIGRSLPTNVTEVSKLNTGPKLKNITKIKKPVLSWLINRLNDLNFVM
jgi:hypothetical protein